MQVARNCTKPVADSGTHTYTENKKEILHFPTHYIEPVTMGPYFHKERKCVFSRIKKIKIKISK